jgi:hypothetical protein
MYIELLKFYVTGKTEATNIIANRRRMKDAQ